MISIILLVAALVASVAHIDASKSRTNARHEFSPRMDYDEWRPLGRGDPLKNDPTYDYMPPVLDRVHYWVDPEKRTPDPPILVSNVITEPAPTLVAATSRLGSFNLFDPLFKLMGKTKNIIGAGITSSFRPTTPPVHYPSTYYPPSMNVPPKVEEVDYMPPPPPQSQQIIQALQRPPYTMLMPPPLPPSALSTTTSSPLTSFATSTQTTQVPHLPLATTMLSEEVTNSPTAATGTTVLANAENLYKPVAITMPESISNETSDDLYTTAAVPNPTAATFPIFSMFNEDTNHLQDQEGNPPVVLPPDDKYYGFLPTTVRTTTATQILTTDPIFKHYKQPSKPAKGPFYLIIQGHSKVKTYGASKLAPLSMNGIHFDDSKMDNYDDYNDGKYRNARMLRIEREEVIHGHPAVNLETGYQVGKDASYEGSSEARNEGGNDSSTLARYAGRRLLATVTKTPTKLDENQLHLESLIGINDDYNGEDIINLLLKQDGQQGSGFGGLVSSLFGKSLTSNDEI